MENIKYSKEQKCEKKGCSLRYISLQLKPLLRKSEFTDEMYIKKNPKIYKNYYMTQNTDQWQNILKSD